MDTFPTGHGGSSSSGDPHWYGLSNTPTGHSITNSIRGDSNTNVGSVSNSYGSTSNMGVDEESLPVRAPLEPHRRHRDGSVNPTLLGYGVQGVGKTYIRKISSLVIDTLRGRARGRGMAVLSLYCDYQARKEQSPVNMIGDLIERVALRAVGELRRQDPPEFLRALRQIIQDAPNTRLFLTGRPDIRRELDRHLTNGAYIVHIVADQGDTARHVGQGIDDEFDYTSSGK
ncbi:unnamed protein product [Tuber aestivum]|uniref:Uncharacterized protein n=1 Tax=Tuber aestivum TaxID=59557 RepID=A0A292PKJ2_9PEZI|nr:unnamed protein product [Tuber aestivum]